MKKPKLPSLSAFALPAVLAAWMFYAVAPAAAHELKDVSLVSGGNQTYVKLTFAQNGSEGEYPLYFQKSDPERGTLTISFLETESPFPLGKYPLDAGSPGMEEVLLKKLTSPSGKSFLGVEMKLKDPPPGEALIGPQGKGALKIVLANVSKGKFTWSLGKSLKAREEYMTAQAEPPPKKGTPSEPASQAGDAPAGEVSSAPQPPAAPSASPAETGAQEPALTEMKMMVSKSQEDFLLIFDPPAAPVYKVEKDPKRPKILRLVLDGAKSSLARSVFVPPQSGLFKSVNVVRLGKQLALEFRLAGDAPIHILPQENGLSLTGAGKGEAATPFKWSSSKPEAEPALADATADPVQSAHEEGAALEAASRAGKGLSSSRTFSLGKGGKSMMLLKDSAALKAQPGGKGKTLKKLPLGEKVEKLDKRGTWLKVASGPDTGYIRRDWAAYEDEMTPDQSKNFQARMEAKQAREAARQQAELAAVAAPPPADAAPQGAAEPQAAEPAESAVPAEPAPAEPAAGRKAPKVMKVSNTAQPQLHVPGPGDESNLAVSGNPDLAKKLAEEKKAAEDEKMRVEPEEKRIAYNSYGRRDPFIPVEQGAFDNGIDIDQMKVVGIIWQSQEPMAVLEHNRESGLSFTVKQGDPVHNGRVARITRDAVTFDISEYGISRSYSLKLVSSQERTKK